MIKTENASWATISQRVRFHYRISPHLSTQEKYPELKGTYKSRRRVLALVFLQLGLAIFLFYWRTQTN